MGGEGAIRVCRYVVTKVGAALQSCHHANDHPDVRRDDLLLAEKTHIREEPENDANGRTAILEAQSTRWRARLPENGA